MNVTEYIRALAEAITRQEDLSDSEARDLLYELALRIYALLLRELPEQRFDRYMAWPRIRRTLTPDLLYVNDRLQQIMLTRLPLAEAAVIAPIATYFQIPFNALKPRLIPELWDATTVQGTSMSRLFAPAPRTGIPPFVTQLLQLLERTVLATFFDDLPTAKVAQRVTGVRVRTGILSPVPGRGTVANNWRERYRSIAAAALWSVVTPASERAASITAQNGDVGVRLIEWRWNAILDPRTCPVCRPLHNSTATSPRGFPSGAPPLHPRCRCVVVPMFL